MKLDNSKKGTETMITDKDFILENSEFYSGHKALQILSRRAYPLADKYVRKVATFQKMMNDYWDKKEKEHNVSGYYNLPEIVRDKEEKFLGSELRKIWNEVNEDARTILDYHKFNRVVLAIKIICFNDYGYLKNESK